MAELERPTAGPSAAVAGASRELCPLEAFYLAPRARAVLASVVRGDLDEKRLAEAFAAKVAQHPSLRCRVVRTGERPVFRPLDPAETPVLDLRPGGPGALADEWNAPLPADGPLIRATLLSTGNEHTLVLCVDHLVCDGRSLCALHAEIWHTYGELVEGRSATAPPSKALPAPLSQLLPPSRPEDVAEYAARLVEQVRRQPVSALPYTAQHTGRPPGSVRVRRALLEPDTATGLLKQAREAGASLHSLVSAALLLTVRRELDRAPGPLTLGCSSPIDLRGRLRPRPPTEAMVPTVTSCTGLLTVDRDTDPLKLAHAVTDHLRGIVRRGEHVLQARLLAHVADHPELMESTVLSSSVGAVPVPQLPAGLRLTDLRGVIALDRYVPEAGQGPVLALTFGFEDRIVVELPYSPECFSDEQIEEIRDGVQELLTTWAVVGL
jgi:hypothetical protein